MRRPVVAGNWKMNGARADNARLLAPLVAAVREGLACEVLVFPPYVYLPQALDMADDSGLGVGAQNASDRESGAYTGEVAATMLADLGASHVLVGHSERRALYGEEDKTVAAKFAAALSAGLTPVLCVGETQAERESGRTEAVVARQLAAVLDAVGVKDLGRGLVAYEPVWAIGTGLTATPEQAQAVHAFLREEICRRDATIGNSLRILYGGSVKAANAATLFACEDVDGGLVGGASLDAEEFLAICRAAV